MSDSDNDQTSDSQPINPTPRIKPVVVEEVVPTNQELASNEPLEPEQKESEPEKDSPAEAKTKGVSFKLIVLVVVATSLIVGLTAGGIYVYLSSTNSGQEKVAGVSATPTPFVMPTSVPTPSPEPEKIDYSSYKISILNGSGRIGEASKVKALLEKEDFQVTGTGNAKTFDFDKTLIQAKKEVPEGVIDKLIEVLVSSYAIETGNTLAASETSDIVITLGLE